MRKLTIIFTITLIVIMLVAIALYTLKSDSNFLQNDLRNNSSVINNYTEITPAINITNFTSSPPAKEPVENSIDWSEYPNIGYHYIHELRIAGPNSVINHTFLLVYWKIEIKNPEDVLENFQEMARVIKQERMLVGQNSGIEILGEVEGIVVYRAGMLPYNTTIYLEDYYHPVNDLTWSQIDANEVDFNIQPRQGGQGAKVV